MKHLQNIADILINHPLNFFNGISEEMLRFRITHVALVLTIVMLFSAAVIRPAYGEGVTASYLYNLSDFSGAIPFDTVKLYVDRGQREVYVIDADNSVRIFNEAGMEVYRINEDGSLGNIVDVAVVKDGTILLLTTAFGQSGKRSLPRCNYQGEPMAALELKNIPSNDLAHPNALVYSGGRIYLADKGSMRVVVTDEQGVFERSVDLFAVTDADIKKRTDFDISGFTVDPEGNIIFTVPILFKAFKLSPDGTVASFGQSGHTPGKFNIIAGIATDDNGNYYLSDKLKCAVSVFDKNYKFVTQFGHRGNGPGGLIVPMELAVLDNKLYVTQSAQRGVSVFKIKH